MKSSAGKTAPPLAQRPDTAALKAELVVKHGEAQRARIERGVEQVAGLWRPEDGDLAAFARENFISDPKLLDATFERFERIFEQLDGHFNELGRELRWASDVDVGPLLPVDPVMAAYDPSANPAFTGTPFTVTARSVRGIPTRNTSPGCTWPDLPSACSTAFQSGSAARASPAAPTIKTTATKTRACCDRCDLMVTVSS